MDADISPSYSILKTQPLANGELVAVSIESVGTGEFVVYRVAPPPLPGTTVFKSYWSEATAVPDLPRLTLPRLRRWGSEGTT